MEIESRHIRKLQQRLKNTCFVKKRSDIDSAKSIIINFHSTSPWPFIESVYNLFIRENVHTVQQYIQKVNIDQTRAF